MKQLFLIVAFLISANAFAGTVDTVSIYSNSMRKSYKCVVIKPDAYKKKNTTFPTVYLLHGLTGDFSNWISKVSELKQHADTYQMLIVCPDGAYSSWYWDSPVDTSLKFVVSPKSLSMP